MQPNPRHKAGDVWGCKIGFLWGQQEGADLPMRKAVSAAFKALTGKSPEFIFSGWGESLTDSERKVLEESDHPSMDDVFCDGQKNSPSDGVPGSFPGEGKNYSEERCDGGDEG